MVHNQISSVSPRDSWEPFLIIAIAMASEPSQVSTEAILEEIYNSIGGSLFCLKIVGNGCDMREPNTILRYFETNLRQKRCVCVCVLSPSLAPQEIIWNACHAQPISSISALSKCFARVGVVWSCPRRVWSLVRNFLSVGSLV